MIVLDDGEVAELTPNAIRTIDLDQRDRDKRVEKILHQPEDADVGDFEHFMLKEIYEQPAALDRSMRGRLDAGVGSVRLGGLQSHESRLFDVRRVVFFACGTSLYSAQVGAYLMSRYARVPAHAEDAAELSVQNPIVDRHTLYVAISDSLGEQIQRDVERARIGEQRGDVLEEDPRLGKVGHVAQVRAEVGERVVAGQIVVVEHALAIAAPGARRDHLGHALLVAPRAGLPPSEPAAAIDAASAA